MNIIIYFVLIFLMLMSNVNDGLPFLHRKERNPPSIKEQDDSDNKLLQKFVDTLQRWLSLQISKILTKVAEVDYSLSQKIFETKQANEFKFDAITHSVAALHQEYSKCKSIQNEVSCQKVEVTKQMEVIQYLKNLLDKIETNLEFGNVTLQHQFDCIQNKFANVKEKMNDFCQLWEEVKTFKQSSENDIMRVNSQLQQLEVIIGKLVNDAAITVQITNDMQQNTQKNIQLMAQVVVGLKNEMEQEKSVLQTQAVELQEQFNNEIIIQKRKMDERITNIHMSLTSSLEVLNSSQCEVNENNFLNLKASVDKIAQDLLRLKIADQEQREAREQILRELYIQKQEISKQGDLIRSIVEDMEMLASFSGYKSGFKKQYDPKK